MSNKLDTTYFKDYGNLMTHTSEISDEFHAACAYHHNAILAHPEMHNMKVKDDCKWHHTEVTCSCGFAYNYWTD